MSESSDFYSTSADYSSTYADTNNVDNSSHWSSGVHDTSSSYVPQEHSETSSKVNRDIENDVRLAPEIDSGIKALNDDEIKPDIEDATTNKEIIQDLSDGIEITEVGKSDGVDGLENGGQGPMHQNNEMTSLNNHDNSTCTQDCIYCTLLCCECVIL